MAPPPQQPPRDAAEDFWLACHDLWLQPVEWLTEWWNACVLPTTGHRLLHAPKIAPGHGLTVPEPIAGAAEQDLFA